MKAKIYISFIFLLTAFIGGYGQGMIIRPNGNVRINSGAKLIISGSSNNLTIGSDSTGTGSLMVDNISGSSVTVPTGHANVQRYLATGMWHYISSPISNGLTGIFLNDYLMTSDPSTSTGWAPYIVPVTVPLVVMRGYAVWKPATNPGLETFTGDLNGNQYNNTYSINISRTATDPWAGWNLVGNPYPSSIDLTAAGVSWGQIEHSAWFWNGLAGNYEATVTMSGIWPYNGGLHSSIVPATQGFYVHVNDAYSGSTSLGFDNSVRISTAQSFLKSVQNPLIVIKAAGNVNSYYDRTSVQFNSNATPGYDPGYDAYKLLGLTEAPQLYTMIGDTNVTINSFPFLTAQMIIPMGFSCGVPGNYTLSADSLDSFASQISITLEDLKLSKTQDLRTDPVYTFTYDTTDNSSRFLLHFNDPSFGISNEKTGIKPIRIYSYEHSIYIRNTGTEPMNGQLFVFDPLGKQLYTFILIDSPLSRYDVNLNTGYYIAKVVTSNNLCSQKVFIRN